MGGRRILKAQRHDDPPRIAVCQTLRHALRAALLRSETNRQGIALDGGVHVIKHRTVIGRKVHGPGPADDGYRPWVEQLGSDRHAEVKAFSPGGGEAIRIPRRALAPRSLHARFYGQIACLREIQQGLRAETAASHRADRANRKPPSCHRSSFHQKSSRLNSPAFSTIVRPGSAAEIRTRISCERFTSVLSR